MEETTSELPAQTVPLEEKPNRPFGNTRGPLKGATLKLPEQLIPYQFKPGMSGNPGGKRKHKPITEAYEKLLAMDMEEFSRWAPKTMAEFQALKMFNAGGREMIAATKEITNRVEGAVARAEDQRAPTQILVVNAIPRALQDEIPGFLLPEIAPNEE